MKNRSVPADVILPHIVYADVGEAIAWLSRTFGFVEHYRYGPAEAPAGAQVRFGDAWMMLRGARPGCASPDQLGHYTQHLTLFVDDVDAHHARAIAAGARIVEELNETPYGERQYVAQDPEGHLWLFSQHIRDVEPAEWGATVANPSQED